MELSILVIEDDRLMRKALYDRLSGWGHQVRACETIAEAEALLEDNSFDLILTDMCLPDGDGVEFTAEKRKNCPDIDVVLMTAFADVRSAVAALKNGAYDYLPKPFEDTHLEKIIRNIADKRALGQQVSSLSRMMATGSFEVLPQFGDMIGSASMRDVFEMARKIAKSPDTTVLVLGESGTGKGMLAKAIHRASPRKDKPFIDINCAAIPGQLIESELFGYEKGAFTDAKIRKPGLLEVAQGGTVFLDEIGDMETNLQGKLLKVLEDKEFRRLGSSRSIRVDVRVITATNRNLKQMVEDGKFRDDLYYRLSVVPIVMPPLREHKDCISLLADCYLQYYSKQAGRQIRGFTRDALGAMHDYSWPGNVRELRNVVERSVILATGNEISASDLGIPTAKQPAAAEKPTEETPVLSMADCEKKHIVSVLEMVNWNKNKAADILKIHRTTLYKKIEEYALSQP